MHIAFRARHLVIGGILALLCFLTLAWSGAANLTPEDAPLVQGAESAPVPQTDVELARLPVGVSGAGVYIQFDQPTENLDKAHGLPVEGGHYRYGWDTLEPNYDNDYRFDEVILPWVQQEANRGKKVAIGFTTYNGRYTNGGIKVPAWLWAMDPNVRLYNTRSNDGWYVLNYRNRTYVNKYNEFIVAFANWVASNPTVRNALAYVEIGTGQFGENQPAAKSNPDTIDYEFYRYNLGWTTANWIDYCNEVSDFYRNAFNSVGMTSLPIFTNIAPSFLAGWERDVIAEHAVNTGVGLKNAGLVPDHNNGAVSYGPLINYWDDPRRVPICWEIYGKAWPGVTADFNYWVIYAGLDKHPDYFLATRDQVTDPEFLPSTQFGATYSGVTLDTTPSVWVTLRETMFTGRYDYPEHGNFEFWLYQDDYTMGRTVTETNLSRWNPSDPINNPAGDDVRNRLGLSVYNPNLGTAKEGWYTRRTNQGDGNPYMWFKIDDGYIYGNSQAVIKVIYYDYGSDTWSLRYDAASGEREAIPDGSTNPWVQKTNSRTWKTATFTITDGRFRNYMAGGHDFRIDCRNDGDEWIHFVDVRKGGGGSSYQISLATGPNLISLPLIPTDPTLTTVLLSVSGSYTKVFAYINNEWKRYIVGAPSQFNNLTTLDEKLGFWLYMSEPGTLNVTGSTPGISMISLGAGANLVGYPSTSSRPLADALDSISGKYTKVFAYINGEWKRYIVGAPSQFNNLTHMEPGRGYWIYTTEACTWTVSN